VQRSAAQLAGLLERPRSLVELDERRAATTTRRHQPSPDDLRGSAHEPTRNRKLRRIASRGRGCMKFPQIPPGVASRCTHIRYATRPAVWWMSGRLLA